MQIIPVLDVPNQTLNLSLGGQSCTIDLYSTTSYGFYCDLYVNNVLILGGTICQNLNRIVRNAYFGFIGDLIWEDTAGSSDPSSPGLGTRYQFIYLEASDLATLGISE